MVWIQIWTDVLSILVWVQTVWKGYQQTRKVAALAARKELSMFSEVKNVYFMGGHIFYYIQVYESRETQCVLCIVLQL